MITVSVLINNKPIYTRSALNVTKEPVRRSHANLYTLDTGEQIKHIPSKGAVELAIKMLRTIKS